MSFDQGEPLDIGTLSFTKVSGTTFTAGPPVPEPSMVGALWVVGAATARRRHPLLR